MTVPSGLIANLFGPVGKLKLMQDNNYNFTKNVCGKIYCN